MDSMYNNVEELKGAHQFVEVADGQMAYIDIGEGKPLLMLHGIPTNSWMYRQLIFELQDKGYRIIVPDLLGFGSSDKPKELSVYAFEKQADRLVELMTHLGINYWTQLFHDMGGLVTWELLSRNPSKIEKLVILNTIAFKDGFNPPMDFQKENIIHRTIAGLYDTKLFDDMMVKSTLKGGVEEKKFSKDEMQGYTYPLKDGGGRALCHFFTSFDDFMPRIEDYNAMMKTLDIPATVIWGAKDLILDASKQVPLLQQALNISDEYVYILEEGKHYIMEEQASEIAEIIAGFV